MTTTYLQIPNMVGDQNIDAVRKLLRNVGVSPISFNDGEVKIGWKGLSCDDLRKIKSTLIAEGYKLDSVYQTTWTRKIEGANVL